MMRSLLDDVWNATVNNYASLSVSTFTIMFSDPMHVHRLGQR